MQTAELLFMKIIYQKIKHRETQKFKEKTHVAPVIEPT